MEVQSTIINITSEDPRRLYEFYRDVVGLPVVEDMGEMTLNAGGTFFGFDGHSQVAGRAKEPQRYLIDFMIADNAGETARLSGAGVPCLRNAGVEYWGGIISTFTDPDGNYFQVIEYDPSKAQPVPQEANAT